MTNESSKPPAFDVITVPDFSGRSRAVFEARTLVFLATWMEYAGNARTYPLHLACIGEPPESVYELAERCQARITIHQPLQLQAGHHVGNKLRGLEINPETDHHLLLDVDIAILSDLSSIGHFSGRLAASPDDAPNVTLNEWALIYSSLGLPMPTLIEPLVHELGMPRFPRRMMGFESEDQQTKKMYPYYNGGVVFAPWKANLRQNWEASIKSIASLFDKSERSRRWIHQSDQAGLAITLALLRKEGWEWQRLPDVFNTRWQHLYAGTLDPDSIVIMHCCWSFLNSIDHNKVSSSSLKDSLHHFFFKKIPHRYQKVATAELIRLRPDLAYKGIRGGIKRAKIIHSKILRACEIHVDAVLSS